MGQIPCMIYKAGRKYIDLERVTAIEPILCHSSHFYYLDKAPEPNPDSPSITGARIDCQLHEKPIELLFSWDGFTKEIEKLPSQQFDDLMQAWRSVVEKRGKPSVQIDLMCERCGFTHPTGCCVEPSAPIMVGGSKACDRCQRLHAVGADCPTVFPSGACPLCHTFHNSNEVCLSSIMSEGDGPK
jgi:hypothetical protein